MATEPVDYKLVPFGDAFGVTCPTHGALGTADMDHLGELIEDHEERLHVDP